jgi:hypothetical protein
VPCSGPTDTGCRPHGLEDWSRFYQPGRSQDRPNRAVLFALYAPEGWQSGNAAVSKTVRPGWSRGFKSHPLRNDEDPPFLSAGGLRLTPVGHSLLCAWVPSQTEERRCNGAWLVQSEYVHTYVRCARPSTVPHLVSTHFAPFVQVRAVIHRHNIGTTNPHLVTEGATHRMSGDATRRLRGLRRPDQLGHGP